MFVDFSDVLLFLKQFMTKGEFRIQTKIMKSREALSNFFLHTRFENLDFFFHLCFVISWKYCHRCTLKSEVQVIETWKDISQKEKHCIGSQLHSRYDRLNENLDGKNMISFCRQSCTRTLPQDIYLTSSWHNSLELASHFITKHSEKSWIHSPRFCDIRNFYSFTENTLKVQWPPPLPMHACSLCSGCFRFQAWYFLTRAINPQCFLVIDLALLMQISMYSSHDSK